MKKKTTCPHCESQFRVVYDDVEVDGIPTNCPFCGGKLEDDYIDFEDRTELMEEVEE